MVEAPPEVEPEKEIDPNAGKVLTKKTTKVKGSNWHLLHQSTIYVSTGVKKKYLMLILFILYRTS